MYISTPFENHINLWVIKIENAIHVVEMVQGILNFIRFFFYFHLRWILPRFGKKNLFYFQCTRIQEDKKQILTTLDSAHGRFKLRGYQELLGPYSED